MFSLGILDIILVVILIAAVAVGQRRRRYGLFLFFLAIFLLIMAERFAPGFFTAVGNTIHGIDAINNQGPHLTVNSVITFK
jgi:hypothetical protein